jgi:hypothetical protein
MVADIASSADLSNADPDPAIGSIATDRAIKNAIRMRTQCIIVSVNIEAKAPIVKSQDTEVSGRCL